jgi:hypothetical protein
VSEEIAHALPVPVADFIARVLHNEGDGGIWEEFDWKASVEVAAVLGPVVERLVRHWHGEGVGRGLERGLRRPFALDAPRLRRRGRCEPLRGEAVSNPTHWLMFNEAREVVGCHCGFQAADEDEGYGDSVVDHLMVVEMTEFRRAVFPRVRSGEIDPIWLDELDDWIKNIHDRPVR